MPADRDDIFASLADPDLDHEQDALWDAALAVDGDWHGDGLALPHRSPLTTALARLDAPLGRLGDALTRALDGVVAAGRGRRPLALLARPMPAGGRTRAVAAMTAGLLTAAAVGGLLSTNGPTPISGEDASVAAGAPTTTDDGRLLGEPAVLIPPTAISRSGASPAGPQGAEVAVGGSSGGAPRFAREAEGDGSSHPDADAGLAADGSTAVLGSSTGGAPPSGTPSPGHASPSGDDGAPAAGGAPDPIPSGPPDGGGDGDPAPEPTTPPPTEPAPPPTDPAPTTPPATDPPPPRDPVCLLLPLLCPGGGLIP